MRTFYVAEVASPCGGRPMAVESSYLAGLEAALDRAFGVDCDEVGRELGAIGPAASPLSARATTVGVYSQPGGYWVG